MADKPIPVEQVRQMVSTGFSERDIIKQLKAQGFSFGDIEKAIMEVVKTGVGGQAESQILSVEPGPAEVEQQPQQRTRKAYNGPEDLEPLPPLQPGQDGGQWEGAPAGEDEQQYVEDIVESVLEEKFEKFTSEMKIMKEELEQLRSNFQIISQKKPGEAELPVEFVSRIDDLEARIGGLEKAFRQYLPELARSIERLSTVVKENR